MTEDMSGAAEGPLRARWFGRLACWQWQVTDGKYIPNKYSDNTL